MDCTALPPRDTIHRCPVHCSQTGAARLAGHCSRPHLFPVSAPLPDGAASSGKHLHTAVMPYGIK